MYEIDLNTPPPAPQELTSTRPGRPPTYPWEELMVNASFFVPTDGADTKVMSRRLTQALRDARRRTHKPVGVEREFVWAERTFKGKRGLRVWRMK